MFLFRSEKIGLYKQIFIIFLKDGICHNIIISPQHGGFFYNEYCEYDGILYEEVRGIPRIHNDSILKLDIKDFYEGDITKEVMIYGRKYLDLFKIYLPPEFCDLMDEVLSNPTIKNHYFYQDDEYYDYIPGISEFSNNRTF